MKKKEVIVYIIAIIFFITLLLMVINKFQESYYYELMWFCYISILIIIFGLFKKNSKIILSQVIILAIPDLLWIFDFLYLILFGHTLLGLADNLLGNRLLDKITSFQHLYVVPLSLVALSSLKINKSKKSYNILFASLAELTLIFFITLFFVPNSQTVNCVHLSCVKINMTFLPYPLLWFLFAFSFAIISYLIIINIHVFIKKG